MIRDRNVDGQPHWTTHWPEPRVPVEDLPCLTQDDWGYHEAARTIAWGEGPNGCGGPLAELVAHYRSDMNRLREWGPRFHLGDRAPE
jgi:hypothetical protein